MKKSGALLLLLLSWALLTAETRQLISFTELMAALNNGELVRVVIHYGQCQLISGNEEKQAPDAIGGMTIDVYEYFAPLSIGNQLACVIFSHSSLINYGGFIYDYVKFRIYENGEVKVTAQYASTEDFSLEMDENFFTVLNDGNNDGALYLYKIK
ncbi:MAG: hypothetical protein JXB60_06895 [Candidatus Cloacimonetes bacterium]|nr:hypothetical protein [Candidatus Cloacimonadota bacterium]